MGLRHQENQPVSGNGLCNRQHGLFSGDIKLQHHAWKKHQAADRQHRQGQVLIGFYGLISKIFHDVLLKPAKDCGRVRGGSLLTV